MYFDWSSLFLFSSVVSSAIGVVYLLYSYQTIADRKSMHWLMVVMAANVTIFIEYIIRNSGLIDEFPHVLFIGTPAYFIFLPALYVYQSRTAQVSVSASLHFIIPGIVALLMVPTYLMGSKEKLAMFTEPGITDPIWIILVYLAFYSFYLVRIIKGIRSYRSGMNRELSSNEVEWDRVSSSIVNLVVASALGIPFVIGVQYLKLPGEMTDGFVKVSTVLFSFSGHFVLASLLMRKNWVPLTSVEAHLRGAEVPVFRKEELDDRMNSGKFYLDRELTLDSLAEQVGWSRTSLSQIINGGFNQNFYDYVNGFRLRALEEKLRMGEHLKYSLDHLVKECGFTNYVTFYRFFKRKNGQSPSAFIKALSVAKK
jgi:AraC-like DNA-binding protein